MTPKVKTIHKPEIETGKIGHLVLSDKDAKPCPICGTTENLMVNGYCVDCDEELTNQIK